MSDEKVRRIQERAYELWEREGRVHGHDQDHWLEAERQVAAEEGGGGAAGEHQVTRAGTAEGAKPGEAAGSGAKTIEKARSGA